MPGTPLVAFLRRIRPMAMTMAAATSVAQTMSTSMVSGPSLTWGWMPGVMSIPSIGVVRRWLPSPMTVRHRPGCRRSTRGPAAAVAWPMLSSITLALITSSMEAWARTWPWSGPRWRSG